MRRNSRRWSRHGYGGASFATWPALVLAGAAGLASCGDWGEPAGNRNASAVGADIAVEPPPPTFGLDSTYVAAAFSRAAQLPRLRCLLVARHGEILAERCYRGPGPDDYANIKSVSKSVVSALVGIALAEGHLDGVDQPILPFFSEHVGAEAASAGKHTITVGNLLSMQSGLERTSGNNYGAWVQSPNWVRYAITRPLVAPPGTTRLYSTGNTHLLSAILTRTTGRNTLQYAREKLAEPLGIRLPSWPTDPQGIFFGGNEMRMTPRDMIRFGELYRNNGRAGNRQIVPEDWIRESLSSRAPSRARQETYGYGWFLGRVRRHPLFYAQGYGGQFIFVVPDLELTVVTTSHPEDPRTPGHNQAIQALLREYIIPAAEAGA